jgi:uncharacterized protein
MLVERIGSSQFAEMSAQGASVAGSLRPAELPRLRAVIARPLGGPDEPLEVSAGFALGPESYPVVQLRVSGTIYLTCQRCLAPVNWPLDLDVALTAVASDEMADELADPFDSVLLDEEGGLALRAVVEDEILAALPLAPLHGDGAGCRSTRPELAGPDENPQRKVNMPFADLGTLMRRDDRNK